MKILASFLLALGIAGALCAPMMRISVAMPDGSTLISLPLVVRQMMIFQIALALMIIGSFCGAIDALRPAPPESAHGPQLGIFGLTALFVILLAPITVFVMLSIGLVG